MALHQISVCMRRGIKKDTCGTYVLSHRCRKVICCRESGPAPQTLKRVYRLLSLYCSCPERGYGCSAKKYFIISYSPFPVKVPSAKIRKFFANKDGYPAILQTKSTRKQSECHFVGISNHRTIESNRLNHRTSIIDRYGRGQPVIVAGDGGKITAQRKLSIDAIHRPQRPGL